MAPFLFFLTVTCNNDFTLNRSSVDGCCYGADDAACFVQEEAVPLAGRGSAGNLCSICGAAGADRTACNLIKKDKARCVWQRAFLFPLQCVENFRSDGAEFLQICGFSQPFP